MRVFAWDRAAQAAGLERDAAYLVRPDGYVALAAAGGSAGEALAAYADKVGLRFA